MITNNYNLLVSSGDVKVVNGRLVFANVDVYIKTFNSVASMTKSQMDSWESSLGFNSLRTYNLKNIKNPRLSELDLPLFKATIINPDGEYQIGNIIYWLNSDSKIYVIPNANEKLLKETQKNSSKSNVKTLPFFSKNIPIKSDSGGGISINTITIGNGADARYQYQYQAGGHTYKMVFQVRGFTEGHINPYTGEEYTLNNIFTEVKLEYLQTSFWGNRWVQAGETAVKRIRNANYYIVAKTGIYPEPVYSGRFEEYDNSNQTLSKLFATQQGELNGLNWEVTLNGDYYENVPVHNQTYSLLATW